MEWSDRGGTVHASGVPPPPDTGRRTLAQGKAPPPTTRPDVPSNGWEYGTRPAVRRAAASPRRNVRNAFAADDETRRHESRRGAPRETETTGRSPRGAVRAASEDWPGRIIELSEPAKEAAHRHHGRWAGPASPLLPPPPLPNRSVSAWTHLASDGRKPKQPDGRGEQSERGFGGSRSAAHTAARRRGGMDGHGSGGGAGAGGKLTRTRRRCSARRPSGPAPALRRSKRRSMTRSQTTRRRSRIRSRRRSPASPVRCSAPPRPGPARAPPPPGPHARRAAPGRRREPPPRAPCGGSEEEVHDRNGARGEVELPGASAAMAAAARLGAGRTGRGTRRARRRPARPLPPRALATSIRHCAGRRRP